MRKGIDDPIMLALRVKTVLSARRLAIKRDGRKRHEHIIADQDDVGPRMPDDLSLALIERLGVLRMYTGSRLHRTINKHSDLPGKTLQVVKTL